MNFMVYRPLFWLLLLLPLLLVFIFSLVNRPARWKWAAFLLRGLGILLLILALCRPFLNRWTERQHVIFLVDVSESVDLAEVKKAHKEIRDMVTDLRPGDSYETYCFADQLRELKLDEFPGEIARWEKGFGDEEFRKESKLGGALNAIRLLFPADRIKRVVIFSDGLATDKNLNDSLASLSADQVKIFFHALQNIQFPEAAVTGLEVNTSQAYFGEKVRFSAQLFANHDMKAKLRFLNRGVVAAEVPVDLLAGQV